MHEKRCFYNHFIFVTFNHRYVVQYYGNYFKGDNCWIIMEYCAFGSVGDLLNLTSHPLSEPQISF